MEHVFGRVSYPAAEYQTRARTTLLNLSPTHGQLLPLAMLLAKEAVKKQPAQAGLFASLFRQAGYSEQASAFLRHDPNQRPDSRHPGTGRSEHGP